MAKEKLPVEVQTFIVQQLACFDAPSVVVSAVKAEFGRVISRQQAESYDPTKRAFNGNERWKILYEETRKAFLEDTSKIGISHRSVRVRSLERMAALAEGRGQIQVAASLLEQAAKEMGNAFTNTRVLTGAGGAPLIPPSITPNMTPKEAADAYADELSAGG